MKVSQSVCYAQFTPSLLFSKRSERISNLFINLAWWPIVVKGQHTGHKSLLWSLNWVRNLNWIPLPSGQLAWSRSCEKNWPCTLERKLGCNMQMTFDLFDIFLHFSSFFLFPFPLFPILLLPHSQLLYVFVCKQMQRSTLNLQSMALKGSRVAIL